QHQQTEPVRDRDTENEADENVGLVEPRGVGAERDVDDPDVAFGQERPADEHEETGRRHESSSKRPGRAVAFHVASLPCGRIDGIGGIPVPLGGSPYVPAGTGGAASDTPTASGGTRSRTSSGTS